MIVNIAEAKANLSKLINLAHQGEKIVIAKNNTPLAEIVVHVPETQRRVGFMSGKIEVPDDFFEEDQELNKLFYGDDS